MGRTVSFTSTSRRCRGEFEARESQGSFWSLPGPGLGGLGAEVRPLESPSTIPSRPTGVKCQGPGRAWLQLGGETSAIAHSKDACFAFYGRRAFETFTPVLATIKHCLTVTGTQTDLLSPCLRAAHPHFPPSQLPSRRAECLSVELGSHGPPSAGAGIPPSIRERLISPNESTVCRQQQRNGLKSLL